MSAENHGYISLHRKIMQNFLFKEKRQFSRFEAWIYLLMSANHSDTEVLLGNQLIKVKKGSFITSEVKLMAEFQWSKSKLRAFLSLLESQTMIEKITDTKKTTLTIVKYSDYQELQTTKKPRKDREKTAKELRADTDNNENNYNNDNNTSTSIKIDLEDSKPPKKEFDFKTSLLSLGIDEHLVNDFLIVRKAKKAVNTENAFNGLVREIHKAQISPHEAIEMCVHKSWRGFEAKWYQREMQDQPQLNFNQNNNQKTQKQNENQHHNAHALKHLRSLEREGSFSTRAIEIARNYCLNEATIVNVYELIPKLRELEGHLQDANQGHSRDTLRLGL